MRLLIVVLLMLALPINGMAQLLMPVESSAPHAMPHMEGMVSGADSQSVFDGAEPECCERHEQGKTSVCKTGQECKTVSLLQIVSAKSQHIPTESHVAAPYDARIPSRLLDAVWHPPRA
ncbi:hypothetical protein V8Z77_14570 [Stutzerimonas stutzeri]|uniref:hypothetical protein n=1 Tax=Stutzerimonas stutzeri TaxID=316 RepID=UPI000C9D0A6A|nr:hypothetical protein [Stutzerimonas stutzeri]PNG14926.1 hypothetical protein CXK97_01650 [Stutzerimonas stutzeri]